MAEPRGMGRGLAAILPEPDAGSSELRELPVSLIKPNPKQPRTSFDAEALNGLASSISETGVVQPLLVRPLPGGSYEIVAGERRWRAAQQAGLERVPAIVRDAAETERLQTALVENMVREDLNPIEEARACAALVEDLGLSKEELARRVGRSRPAVSNLIRLLELPDETISLLAAGELSEGHGRAVLSVRGNDRRRRLARSAAANGWSVRETERRAKLAGQPNPRGAASPGHLSAEEAAAFAEAEDRLAAALGHEVRIRRRRGEMVAEVHLEDVEDALSLSKRLGGSGNS